MSAGYVGIGSYFDGMWHAREIEIAGACLGARYNVDFEAWQSSG